MTYETIEQTINLLCERLGLAVNEASKLIPELVRMGIWSNATLGIICTLIIVILLIVCVKTHKLCENDKFYNESHDILRVGSWSVSFISIPILLYFTFDSVFQLIKWIVAPNIQAIEYITSLIG